MMNKIPKADFYAQDRTERMCRVCRFSRQEDAELHGDKQPHLLRNTELSLKAKGTRLCVFCVKTGKRNAFALRLILQESGGVTFPHVLTSEEG
jgi:hypothetical protein